MVFVLWCAVVLLYSVTESKTLLFQPIAKKPVAAKAGKAKAAEVAPVAVAAADDDAGDDGVLVDTQQKQVRIKEEKTLKVGDLPNNLS